MTSIDRSDGRNIWFYNGHQPSSPLGGLIQNGSVTNRNFFQMLSMLIVVEPATSCYTISRHGSSKNLVISDDRLEIGHYDIISNGKISMTDEVWVARSFSYSISGREDPFKTDVRARDGKCVISGKLNRRPHKSWSGFVAAHIFPLQHESEFVNQNFARRIDQPIDMRSKINSVQNGLLMSADIHYDFDNYLFSINPDDGYKIVSFDEDNNNLDGRVLDAVCRQDGDPARASDQLLRWHFRQTVLANLRGVGEPIFEHDFPPGSDMIKEISEGPHGKERLERELAARLTHVH